jgi:hypothetical protein
MSQFLQKRRYYRFWFEAAALAATDFSIEASDRRNLSFHQFSLSVHFPRLQELSFGSSRTGTRPALCTT